MIRPATESLRHACGFSKLVTVVVLAAFTSLTLQPLALAAQLPARPATAQAAAATDSSAQLAQTLEATEAKLGELIADFTAGRDANPRLQDLNALHQQLKSLDKAALQSFAEVETHLKAKALPQVILDRHSDAVKSYTKDFQTLTNALTALEATPDNPGKKQHAEAAFNHLKEKQKKRGRQPFDPNDLPNKSLQPNPNNTPKLTQAQFFQAGLTDNPTVKLAAHGTFTFDKLPGASDLAYLAATAEVTLTPAIQAKAAELEHNRCAPRIAKRWRVVRGRHGADGRSRRPFSAVKPLWAGGVCRTAGRPRAVQAEPDAAKLRRDRGCEGDWEVPSHIPRAGARLPVKIYNWVRNNVEWLPTWGATQDADVTLGSKRGNAFDIASLLIALYRASGIPARYVHGTIEVSADKFMNWAGGFTSITAAADYASSGGIPVTSVTSGGTITKVQLEHLWVEAAIDFQPSRGAINRSADSWVQLDASFKQYQDLLGLDVIAISRLDPNALAQSFATSGTINETEGWVTGLNPAILQTAQTQAQTALTNYINTNLPNPTVDDVIGGRKIVASDYEGLPSSLPNRSLVTGAKYGILPNTLQNAMTFAFGTDILGDPINPVTFPWSRLNNHKVTLSFKPAAAADEQALLSLLPPGPITDPTQLPSSIPSYLISVIPELAVDGQVVGQGTTTRLGEEINFYYGIKRVSGQGSHTYTYPVIAGSYLGVAVAGGSVSTTRLQDLRAKLIQTKATLGSGNPALIGTLTREDILGDMFHVGTLGYFGQYIALSHVASQPQKARHNLPYGYGTFGYEPNVDTFFGIPRAITPGGVAVNVRLGQMVQARDGDPQQRVPLSLLTGVISSAVEHAVPEEMFSTPTRPAQGISAVKALQIASSQGQRIYHITPTNQVQAMANLRLDALAMSEITQALASGKEVVAHTDRISVPGWTGEGYILFDPVTGAGAYKITGGGNGGWISVGDFLKNILGNILDLIISPALAAQDVQQAQNFVTDWECFIGWVAVWSAVLIAFFLIGFGSFALVGIMKWVGIIGSAFFVDWILFDGYMRCQRLAKP